MQQFGASMFHMGGR